MVKPEKFFLVKIFKGDDHIFSFSRSFTFLSKAYQIRHIITIHKVSDKNIWVQGNNHQL